MAVERDDWRRTGQERYLKGATFERRSFTPPPDNPDWDHEHCSFCWAKFMTEAPDHDPAVMTDGYMSTDGRWVCDSCFEDFRKEFVWSLK